MKLYPSDTTLPLMNHFTTESRDAEGSGSQSGAASFEQCFERYWARIYRLLERMLGDPAEAEDLALETFYRLHRHGPPVGSDSNVGGWLHRVATNLGLQSIRSLRRRDFYEGAAGRDALEHPAAQAPSEVVAERERSGLARQVLASMNARQSRLLVLRYSGMSYKEIASSLNLSPSSIGPMLLRAEREFERRYRALAQEES